MGKLEKEVSTSILLEVYRSSGMTMSQLQQKTGMSTITVLQHVNGMIDAGLLVEEREKVFPRRRLLSASEEGRQVASLLTVAAETEIASQGLMEMGAMAGRITAYKEAIELLRRPNLSGERVMAELLLRDLRALVSGIMLLTRSLPRGFKGSEGLSKICARMDELEREGQRRLAANDLRGAMRQASEGFTSYNECFPMLVEVYEYYRGKGMGEIASYVDSISPKRIQKE